MRGDGGRARTALRKCGRPGRQGRAGGEAGRAGEEVSTGTRPGKGRQGYVGQIWAPARQVKNRKSIWGDHLGSSDRGQGGS